MNAKTLTACLASCLLVVPLIGCSNRSDTDTSHAGAYMKDSAITTKIKTRLASQENMGTLTNVHVNTDNDGNVLLTGTVKNSQDAEHAVALARDTHGVKSVRSEIQVAQ